MRAVSGAPDDLALARELADAADAITMARFRAEDLVVETKPDLTPVSEADRAVEQALREHLAARRPQDTVFGEEYGGGEPGTGPRPPHPPRRRWIVDPIDGTKGYVRGMQVWATLLALEEEGEMVAGVVSAPSMGRRWWAARGAGAFTTDAPGTEPRRLR
ncbi:MAG: inositol monophosphatase family protein, partial [Solirubrobacteraceae bacterium]